MFLRKELYAKEAAAILRIVTTYRVVLEAQLYRFFPGKEEIVRNLLRYLERQGRIVYCEETKQYAVSAEALQLPDSSMLLALWVLVDLITKVEFHSSSDFPTKIVFFADGEMFEILHVPYDSEILMGQAATQKDGDEVKRIVIVDTPDQIKGINIPSVAGFCTVSMDGEIQYYKFQ